MEATDALPAAAQVVSSRILVVEDDAVCRGTVARALRRPDRIVMAVSSAQEALDCIARETFDLFVLDFLLGKGMNGDEILRRLRAAPQTREVPIIILSGEANGKDFRDCFEHGANECLTKPVSISILRKKADELLKARRPMAPAQPGRLDRGDVLLVEGDGYQAELAQRWLAASGHSSRRASTIAEFWGAVAECLPECVVMDLNLGIEDGLPLCDAMKRAEITHAIPIIVFTARPDARPEAYEHQAVCVVNKGPGAEIELPKAVGAVIAQQRRTLGIIDLGDVRVHSPESAVYHRGKKVATLDHGPFAIFLRLVRSSPSAVPDEELRRAAAVRQAYHRRMGAELPPRTMPTYVYNLRQQLGKELGERIRRVNGSGYAYVEPRGSVGPQSV